jgi:c-di-GMP-related signal transduction protein
MHAMPQSEWSVFLQPPLAAAHVEPCTRCLARQAIFGIEQKLQGYELLFRSGAANRFPGGDGDAATCQIIDAFLVCDRAQLTAGRPAYINCTRNILLSDLITLLPPEAAVAEILEDVPADVEMLAACKRLKRAGYTIALDDYVAAPRSLPLLTYADIVKVDFLATDGALQAAIADDMHGRGIHLLAEKVEDGNQLLWAQHSGYDYFQGYYFQRPEPLRVPIPAALCYEAVAEVLQIAEHEDYDIDAIEQAILSEPALCYRLLRYLDNVHLQPWAARSLRQALRIVGRQAVCEALRKLMLLAYCCEHQSWQELPAIGRPALGPDCRTGSAARRCG